jgi:ferredoxin
MSIKVEFRKSGKTLSWEGAHENLLEMAEENGIEIENLCRQGYCGTCQTKMLSGEVEMETTEGLGAEEEEQNMILPCVAVPKTDVVLEA